MKNYESKLNNTGVFFLAYLEERFPHIPLTQKAILHILSLQHDLIWDVSSQTWKIERKGRQGGKLSLERFIDRISTSEI